LRVLWGVISSAGLYQQSKRAVYRGCVAPGETLVIATVEPSGGPANREVVWSWCVSR
jgi:hypothetical protein